MTLILYVGDNTDSVAIAAKDSDKLAYLIDFTNCNIQHSGTCYTSLADLPGLPEFAKLFKDADKIIYIQPTQWSDSENTKKNQISAQYWTEYFLNVFLMDRTKTIVNCPNFNNGVDYQSMIELVDFRKSVDKQLWIAGCSITYGTGVSTDQRYASIIADKLEMPISLLAFPGSSLLWAADQILRSDIREGDIVIWGMTESVRFPYYNGKVNEIQHVNSSSYLYLNQTTISPDFLLSQTSLYLGITSILQVINFCSKINVKLVLADLLVPPDLAIYLNKKFRNYIHLNNFFGVNINNIQFNDYGDDKLHPGPLVHQQFAEKILEKIKQL